jgi:hypothetical protein
MPAVWAATSDTVSMVAGTATPNAAANPRRETAVRREIDSDLIFSVIFRPHSSSLKVFRTDLGSDLTYAECFCWRLMWIKTTTASAICVVRRLIIFMSGIMMLI